MSGKPTITQRDLSYNEAVAGLQAQELAQQMGGDPEQIRVILLAAHAQAMAQPGSVPRLPERVIGGHAFPLHGNLAMTLAQQTLATRAVGEEATPANKLRAMMRMALVLAKPAHALDAMAADETLATLDAEALAFAGGWGEEEATQFAAYVAELRGRQTAKKPPATPAPRRPGKR